MARLTVHQLFNRSSIGHLLNRIHKCDWIRDDDFNLYPSIQMFKVLILAHRHQLSEQALTGGLKARLDFIVFTGFELGPQWSSTLF
jgi:hypothetical protein